MRFATALVLVLALAGCGIERNSAGEPASSDEEKPAVIVGPIVLKSPYGAQTAVRGAYSVSSDHTVLFADASATHPKEVTAVAAGDEVRFVFVGAEIVSAVGCHGGDPQDCIGLVGVKPLGCDRRTIETIPLALGPETRWTVDLASGAYQLDVFASYESEGASGT